MNCVVVQLPGVNCEYETLRALRALGEEPLLLRGSADPAALDAADVVVLPGGWSYEDRIRAGAVAAWDPLVDRVAERAERGARVLGLCNGAQMLVEAGLVPGIRHRRVELALAPNKGGEPTRGFESSWIHLAAAPKSRDTFLSAAGPGPFPMPIAHGEGRFLTRDPRVERGIAREGLGSFVYARPDGAPDPESPWNPNGSLGGLAAVANREGNVVAMMPHPERAFWLWQVPAALPGEWGERRRRSRDPWREPGPGQALFRALLDKTGGRS